MSDQKTNNESSNKPSSSELLGTAAMQINRQGKQEDKGSEPLPPEETTQLFQTFIGFVSITFIVLGLIALAAWGWITLNTEEVPPAPAIIPPNFIYTETTREIQLATSTDIAVKIEQFQKIVDVQAGGFSQFYFTSQQERGFQLVTPQVFFSRLQLNDPGPLFNHVGDTFMYGQHSVSANRREQYVILPVTSYDGAYGQLLQSEASVADLLQPLGFPATGGFSDIIIQNQDVRFASSTSGSIYWAFPQTNRLVITTSQATLRAIFSRLNQTRRDQ